MRYFAAILILAVFFHACSGNSAQGEASASQSTQVQFPLYPGCENYYTPEMQKWCFKKKFIDNLTARLSQASWHHELANAITSDTLWLRIKIDTAGYFHADSLIHIHSGKFQYFLQKIDSIFRDFPPVDPALHKGIPVAVKFKVPVVKAKADNR